MILRAIAIIGILLLGPAAALAEAFRVLKPSGRVLIVDMAAHHREDYRQQMGHVWLGFGDDQMRKFLTQAGFEKTTVTTLPEDPGARGPGLFVATGRRRATGRSGDDGSK